jgi:archaellin
LEDGELVEVTVDLSALTTKLTENSAFTLEVKPPIGGILQINRTTPSVIEAVMELW